MDVFDRESVLQEVITFSNVPGETSGDREGHVGADVVTCINILSTLDIVLTGLLKPARLGKDPPKSDQVNRAIRNYKHLKPSTDFNLVNI
ncbi:hypothetical protein Trydic_g5888 [Trypoxylus dichotomus]